MDVQAGKILRIVPLESDEGDGPSWPLVMALSSWEMVFVILIGLAFIGVLGKGSMLKGILLRIQLPAPGGLVQGKIFSLVQILIFEYAHGKGDRNMYGWRARLGVLVPSGIIAMEPEFRSMTPEGVSCHYHRFKFIGGKDNDEIVERLKKTSDYIADAAEMILDTRPAVVAMTGTGVSFIGGYGYDQMLIKKMKERNGNLPTTTTSTSVIDAFRKLGVTKVSIAMPYVEQVSRTVMKFVEDSGVKVLNAKWLGKGGPDIGEVSKETLYHLSREVDEPDSEALFISCTNLHTIELIEKLETDLGKPVITSNQATMWNMLRLANINDKIEGYGQLFSK